MGRPHRDAAAFPARACVVPAPSRPFLACLALAVGGNAASGLGWAGPGLAAPTGRGGAAAVAGGRARGAGPAGPRPPSQPWFPLLGQLQRSAPGRTERTWRAGGILLDPSPRCFPAPPGSGGPGRAEVRSACVAQTSDGTVQSWTLLP